MVIINDKRQIHSLINVLEDYSYLKDVLSVIYNRLLSLSLSLSLSITEKVLVYIEKDRTIYLL